MAQMLFTTKTVSDKSVGQGTQLLLDLDDLMRKVIGTFQEVLTAKGDVQMKIPDNLSFEEASTLV
jgi:NADPH:quinone reductase-like Zn-dependent oxidoreductase